MKDAIVQTMNDLKKWPGHEETYAAMEKSIGLVGNGMDHRENIENIGGGWIGEEALAIALYCSLSSGGDFKKGVTMAVNHGGDSDSTGAITGNLLGTMVGTGGIPKEWMDVIEMKDIIIRLADDLHTGFKETNEWFQAYPGS